MLTARSCRTAAQKVSDQAHDGDDKEDVDGGGGHVEHGEAEDPREAKKNGEDEEHASELLHVTCQGQRGAVRHHGVPREPNG